MNRWTRGLRSSLENRTGRSVPVIEYNNNDNNNNDDAAENCAAVLTGDFSSLSTRQFSVQGGCLTLVDREVLPLGPFGIEAPSDAGSRPMCGSVAFRAAGLPDTVVIWQDPAPPSANPDQRRVFLDDSGSGLTITGSDSVQSWPATFALVQPNCVPGQ